ncbi:MAG TPA: hypothetical protein VFK05_29660 [Polyangiaceae bacterium]|nr:hypothetical protein [Polyangiaceae bacterium]
MPLRFQNPPDASFERLTEALGTAASGAVGMKTARSSLPTVGLTRPHPVYALGLEQIVQGGDLSHVKPVGWRYFIEGSDGKTVAAEVYLTHQPPGHRMGALNRGKSVEGTLDQLAKANNDARFSAATYDVQLLRVPALCLSFLWLKAPEDHGDSFVAIEPTFSPFSAGEVCSVTELEQRLKPLAIERLKTDDSPHQ